MSIFPDSHLLANNIVMLSPVLLSLLKGCCLVEEYKVDTSNLYTNSKEGFRTRNPQWFQAEKGLLFLTCFCLPGVDDPYEEQTEDPENPLRCPIKLYDFYLFKW